MGLRDATYYDIWDMAPLLPIPFCKIPAGGMDMTISGMNVVTYLGPEDFFTITVREKDPIGDADDVKTQILLPNEWNVCLPDAYFWEEQ